MALLTLAEHKTFASIVGNDPVRDASLTAIIQESIDAVKRYCNNGELELTQYTQILNAPPTSAIILPFAPVHYAPSATPPITFEFYQRNDANGDPSKFTSEYLKTIYTDYQIDFGPTNITVSDSGIVRLNYSPAGIAYSRPLYSLAVKVTPVFGAIKVVYTAGYDPVPPSLKMALNIVVREVFNRRKLGIPINSESLNGYSYSGNGTANGVIDGDPTIRQLLDQFCRPQIGGYY